MSDSRKPEETLTQAGRLAGAALDDGARRELLLALAALRGDELVDSVRADQRRRWEAGNRLPIEEYLTLPPVAAAGPDAAVDLIYSEFILRESLGEPAEMASFERRFPDYAGQLRQLNALDEAFDLGRLSDPDEPTAIGTAPPRPPAVMPGQLFAGKYPVIGVLGEGGQAVVFRAAHPALAREVVVKWSKSRAGDRADRERFLAEGRVLAAIEHPHLARVHDLDLCDDRPYLVMENVVGQNLEQYFGRETLTPRQGAALIAKVARALAAVHRRGVLHQDVKPKNILVDEHGEPRLIDFGLARSRTAYTEDNPEPGSVSGTIAYMAPEQARGDLAALGPRSDLFGLGGALYYLLTGRAPYTDASAQRALERARRGDWDRAPLDAANVPGALRAVCTKALAPDPKDRFPSADALTAALEAFVRRPKVLAWAAASLALVLLLAGVTWAAVALSGHGRGDSEKKQQVVVPKSQVTPSKLTWEVFRDADQPFVDVNVFPLLNGDELRLRATFAEEVRAAVFWFSEGKLEQNQPASKAPSIHLVYPRDGTAKLGGKPGTEFVLLCGRRTGDVTLQEMQQLWGNAGPLPDVPIDTVLILDERGVRPAQKGRPVEFVVKKGDPVGEATRRLHDLGKQLHGRYDVYCGLLFARIEN